MTSPTEPWRLLSTETSTDERERAADLAVLPVGSFEQHGSFLPLITDTVVACAIADAVSRRHRVLLLPPVTVSCSHEHSAFAGTVSISAPTLAAVITDIAASLERAGVRRLVLVNAHGGNYALQNVVQEANVGERRMALYPGRGDWEAARVASGCRTSGHEDMHGGELEVSILLHVAPDLVGPAYETADHTADERPHLLVLGVGAYAKEGIIGRPSLATAVKGEAILDSLAARFGDVARLMARPAE